MPYPVFQKPPVPVSYNIDLCRWFSAVEIRERDWCNIVTCHLGENVAYSWRLQNFVIGQHVLRPSTDDPTPVKVRLPFYRCCGQVVLLIMCLMVMVFFLTKTKRKERNTLKD